MTSALIVLAVSAAVVNWSTRVPRPPGPLGERWVEWLSKPLATLALIGLAATVEAADQSQQQWFVIGLVLCLAGDVALMLPTELFRTGLVSFLLGHLAFIIGFLNRFEFAPIAAIVIGLILLAGCLVIGFVHLLPNVRRRAPDLYGPVLAYVAVIGSMGITSIQGGHWAAPLGAAAFAVSDLTLADHKFVSARQWSPPAVMITYHLALALLVWSLR
ncbi:MAG: lysoplasmalogenase [Acidimicrobiia bacterium]|nr:lysoplasmalogenase [Acidimicrobiia bacterium]